VRLTGQLVDRRLERVERQQVFQLQPFTAIVRGRDLVEALRLLLAEEIGDAIARHAKQPAGDVRDRHQPAVRFHQLVEDVLENVLRVARVGHAPADEPAQPGLLPLDHVGDPLVVFEGHHLLL
jgi:hypothetical protein